MATKFIEKVDPSKYRGILAELRGEAVSEPVPRPLPAGVIIDMTQKQIEWAMMKKDGEDDSDEGEPNPLKLWFREYKRFLGDINPVFARTNSASAPVGTGGVFPCRRRLDKVETTPAYELAGFLVRELLACSPALAELNTDPKTFEWILGALQKPIIMDQLNPSVIGGSANMQPICGPDLTLFFSQLCRVLLQFDPAALVKFIEMRPALLTNIFLPYLKDTSEESFAVEILSVTEKLITLVTQKCNATTVEGFTEWTLQMLSTMVMRGAKYTRRAKGVFKILDILLKVDKADVRERLHNLILGHTKYDSFAREVFDLAWAEVDLCLGKSAKQGYMRSSKLHPLKAMGGLLSLADVEIKVLAGAEGNTVSHTAKLPVTVDHICTHMKKMVQVVVANHKNRDARKLLERLLVVCGYMVRLSQPFRHEFVTELRETRQEIPVVVLQLLDILSNGDGKVSVEGVSSLMMYALTRADVDSSKLREWLLRGGLAQKICKIFEPVNVEGSEKIALLEYRRNKAANLAVALMSIQGNITFMDQSDSMVLESIKMVRDSPHVKLPASAASPRPQMAFPYSVLMPGRSPQFPGSGLPN